MFHTARPSLRCLLRRPYATIQTSSAEGGSIKIDPVVYPAKTVKSPGSKKSVLHAEYAEYYRSNPTMLILQHNNLTQAQLLPIRAELSKSGAKLRIIRVKIFEHAVKVATLQASDTSQERLDVNSRDISIASRSLKAAPGQLDFTQLLSGPICAITFPSSSEVEPIVLKKVLDTVATTQNKLLLLGGRFEGQVFAIDSLARVSNLPGIDTLRGQLLSVLGSPAARLSQLLATPAQTLGRTMEGRKLALENDDTGEAQK